MARQKKEKNEGTEKETVGEFFLYALELLYALGPLQPDKISQTGDEWCLHVRLRL